LPDLRPNSKKPPTTTRTALPMSSAVPELSPPAVAAGAVSLPLATGIAIVEGDGVSPGATGVAALAVEVGVAVHVAVALAATVAVAVAVDVAVPGVALGVTTVAAPAVAVAVWDGPGVTVEPPGGVTGARVSVGPGFGGLRVLVGSGCVGGRVGGLGVGQGTLNSMHGVTCNSGSSRCVAQAAGPARLANTTSVTNRMLPHTAQELIRIVHLQLTGSRPRLSAVTY
jgi:hypothetical protein